MFRALIQRASTENYTCLATTLALWATRLLRVTYIIASVHILVIMLTRVAYSVGSATGTRQGSYWPHSVPVGDTRIKSKTLKVGTFGYCTIPVIP